ncbi:MAG: hypothetical protein J0M12_01705 [Deltaproteobacteria bacterium]|nr:hypothetical protein [Deltaproteobacteria bacterium]
MNLVQQLRFLFGFSSQVTRKQYLVWGFALMLIKYLGELAVAWFSFRLTYPLSVFFLPSYLAKAELFRSIGDHHAIDLFFAFYILWTLPFMWIGVSMSVRRAYDAGLKPGAGMCFLIPFLNYIAMFTLAALPSVHPAPQNSAPPILQKHHADAWRAALAAIAAAMLICMVLVYLSTFAQSSYGTSLFIGLPTIMGAVASWVWNRSSSRGLKSSIAISCFSISVAAVALMLFAAEGFICIIMALPFALLGGILGGLIGEFLANRTPAGNIGLQCCSLTLLLALGASIENRISPPGQTSATTSTEINADAMTVFNNVVEFSELPAPHELIFLAGVAYPIRAHIEGSGVGAVRYCEFSTGPFVEPITAWEPGKRLAFSVTSQPPTMEELSFYKKISPRHLTETFRSLRGEFRLTELGPNRTLLEGTTWYELKMEPFAYWAFLTNKLVHAIHGRVLEHIKQLSEKDRR